MIMCVLLCYPLSIYMSQLLSRGCPISSFYLYLTFFAQTSFLYKLLCTINILYIKNITWQHDLLSIIVYFEKK